jgi:peptide/nickel transport system permease protein
MARDRLLPPGRGHLLGSDQLRRDVLSRVIYGGRIPLLVAVTSCATSLAGGTILGWTAGFAGGRLDRVLSLFMDAIYSFPALILAVAIVAAAGLLNMIAPSRSSTSRRTTAWHRRRWSSARRSRRRARAVAVPPCGCSSAHRANTLSAVAAVLSFNIADAILTEAALSFLGSTAAAHHDWGSTPKPAVPISGFWW